MSKKFRFLALTLAAGFFSLTSFAQQIIKGNVKNASNSENVGAVSVEVKGSTKSTYTDANGNFNITVPSLPVTLIVTSVGYESKEVEVTENFVAISLKTSLALGQEIVVSASRLPQRILESPVSVERLSAAAIRNAPAASFYDILQNLKGVDLMASSLTFKTPTTRGFNGSGNTRFTQLTDYMDNQAPGLNFSVGSVIGLSELDVDNMELLPGASSALYGPGGMNGTLLINSKNPFKYQGLSFQVKTGIMHTDKWQRDQVGSYNNWAVRYAKKVNDRFAFRISTELIQAKDWVGNDYRNYQRLGADGKLVAGTRETDPNYDGINVYGDETTLDIRQVLAGVAAQAPFLQSYVNTLSANPINVSRTGFRERDIIDPNTINYKIGGSINYKISDNTEASFSGYWGTGNTVYTGSERYSLQNLKIGQYKLELNNKKWLIRAYTTQENSGDSYNSTVAARLTNELLAPSTNWYPVYGQTYLASRLNGLSDADAHTASRAAADAGRALPGSVAFRNAFNTITKKPIGFDPVKAGGAKFLDRSDLYSIEGQYNLSSLTNGFAEVLVGGNFRQYSLNSQGTLFADSAGAIGINEGGAYIQVSKKINDLVKFIVSGRYDKNQNFKGKFTPRATLTYKTSETGTLRASYQTAYRFPSTQQQWINLEVGSNVRLIGANPNFANYFNYAGNPIYSVSSVLAGAPVATTALPEFKAETVNSFELGYKGLHVNKKLLVDLYAYTGTYQNFTTRLPYFQSLTGSIGGLGNAATRRTLSIPVNVAGKVNTYGWGIGADYRLPSNFNVSANLSSDVLGYVDAGIPTNFNSPKFRSNVSLSNSAFGYKKRLGFGASYRWTQSYFYQSDFANGQLPNQNTVDCQFSYKLPAVKSTFKLGANNLLNQYYRNGVGNPMIGGLYYISYGYNL
jgi:outer membrane receptor protein involved in Fe transport